MKPTVLIVDDEKNIRCIEFVNVMTRMPTRL